MRAAERRLTRTVLLAIHGHDFFPAMHVFRLGLCPVLFAVALVGCAHRQPPPPKAITMTTHMNGDPAPTTYVIQPNHVQATRKDADGTVMVGTGHNMQEAVANMKPR
jgi:hypothetical protein